MRKRIKSKTTPNNRLRRLFLRIYPFIAISTLAVIIYSNSFDCSFHLDDLGSIIYNDAIRNVQDVQSIWEFNKTRFVGYFSFALNYHFHGLDVYGYHLINLLVHIGASLFAWWLVILILSTPVMQKKPISRHRKLIALLCALVFVSHPLQTQAVTYIVQRLASLASLFYLASLSLYLKGRMEKGIGCYPYFFLSALAAIIGVFTKEIVFTLPFAVLMCEIYFFRDGVKWLLQSITNPRFIIAVIPFVLFLIILPYMLSFSMPVVFGTVESQRHLDPPLTSWTYFMTQSRVIVTYIRLLFLPFYQNFEYDFPASRGFFEPTTLLSFLLLAVILLAAVRMFSSHRLASFGILWFFLTLSVESTFKPLYNVIFEHRLYLPMVGFPLFFISILHYILRKKGARYVLVVMLVTVGIYSVLTYRRNEVWKDDITLWSDVVKKSPGKVRPYTYLGTALYKTGNIEAGKRQFQTAIRLNPDDAKLYGNLGNFYMAGGDLDEAQRLFEKSLSLDPNNAETHYKLGNVFIYEGKTDDGKTQYETAIGLNPGHEGSHYNLGIIYHARGDLDSAVAHLNRTLEIDESYERTHYFLGSILKKQGRIRDAVAHLEEAVRFRPDDGDAHLALASCYESLGEKEKAKYHFGLAEKRGSINTR